MAKNDSVITVETVGGWLHIDAGLRVPMLEIEAAIVSEAYKFYKRELALTARSLGLKTSEVKYFLRWSRIFRAKKKSGKKKSAISFERAPVGRLRIGRPLRDQGK